jgi:hypothetical protein
LQATWATPQGIVDTARKRGEFDLEIPVTRNESPDEVLRKVGEAVQGGVITEIRILDHGNMSGDKGQRIGSGYILPEMFEILRGKMKPGGRIRLDGCMLGSSTYSDYRWLIREITGQRVEASPDENSIVPNDTFDGFESRSRSGSTTITW